MQKRKAEIRDNDLFTQPDEGHYGECPLCCLPLSLDPKKSTMMPCCSKVICNGCYHANKMREDEAGLERRCAFCREPFAESMEDVLKRLTKRIKKNDPGAMRHMGIRRHDEGDYEAAFKYFKKAAELGDIDAHYVLGVMYQRGGGVEKDTEKDLYTTRKRLQLVVILMPGTILEYMSGKMAGLTEQGSIGSSLPTLDIMIL